MRNEQHFCVYCSPEIKNNKGNKSKYSKLCKIL